MDVELTQGVPEATQVTQESQTLGTQDRTATSPIETFVWGRLVALSHSAIIVPLIAERVRCTILYHPIARTLRSRTSLTHNTAHLHIALADTDRAESGL